MLDIHRQRRSFSPVSYDRASSALVPSRRSRSRAHLWPTDTAAPATVTDANLLLGRLQPTRFLGGDFTLDFDRTAEFLNNTKAALRSTNSLPESFAWSIPPWKKPSAYHRARPRSSPLRARGLRWRRRRTLCPRPSPPHPARRHPGLPGRALRVRNSG